MATTQVAVRFDDELLASLDHLVAVTDDSTRADVIRRAVAAEARRQREKEINAQIVAAYTRQPITEDERIPPSYASWNALDDEDWSDW